MKLKILKRLSLLDYFVVFLILLAVGFSLKFLTRESKVVYVHMETGTPEWSVEQYPSFFWLSNSIIKGETVFTPTGQRVGEVIDVYNVGWRGNRRYSRLKIKLAAIYDKRTNQYRINDTPLLVGNELSFNVGNTNYTGTVIYVGETTNPPNYEEKYLKVEIKVNKIDPWLAREYNDSFRVENSDGKIVFHIINTITKPSENTEVNDQGKRVITFDPLYKDVYITAKIWVTCQEGICYFNGTMPVRVGEPISIQSNKSLIEGIATTGKVWIIGVEEFNEEN